MLAQVVIFFSPAKDTSFHDCKSSNRNAKICVNNKIVNN